MLTCITCSKQRTEDREDESSRGTPSTKEAVKSLTAQMNDMTLKVSSNKPGKPPISPISFKRAHRPPYPDYDTISEVPYPYMQPGSLNSTPSWNFTRSGSPHSAGRHETRFSGAFGGASPSAGRISISEKSGEVLLEDDDEPKEWMAQVEPGVQITFVSLSNGGNDLKRIRFSREMFDKIQAQCWWGENYDRIMELYNVQRFNRQAFNTPSRSEDGRESSYSRLESARESPAVRIYYKPSGSKCYFPSDHLNHVPGQHYMAGSNAYPPGSQMDASRTTTSSRGEASASISNASDTESEWVVEDEPGVCITIRQLADGTRELRRVRFSREKFKEAQAKFWWEANRDRIQAQYL